jgi:hypothetical protein
MCGAYQYLSKKLLKIETLKMEKCFGVIDQNIFPNRMIVNCRLNPINAVLIGKEILMAKPGPIASPYQLLGVCGD